MKQTRFSEKQIVFASRTGDTRRVVRSTPVALCHGWPPERGFLDRAFRPARPARAQPVQLQGVVRPDCGGQRRCAVRLGLAFHFGINEDSTVLMLKNHCSGFVRSPLHGCAVFRAGLRHPGFRGGRLG